MQPEDLIHFGIIPELIGRLPVVATLRPLDEEALVRILTEPKNALVKQYETLLAMEGVKLKILPSALRSIAKEAERKKTGARGLRSIMENLLLDVMYEVPGDKAIEEVVVTADNVENGTHPQYVKSGEELKNIDKKRIS